MPAKDFNEQLKGIADELRTSGRHLAHQILVATKEALEVSARAVGETAEALAASGATSEEGASQAKEPSAPAKTAGDDEEAVDAVIPD